MSTSCDDCDGFGYRLQADGARARAAVCACQTECRRCRGSRFVVERDELGYEVARPCECRGLRRRVALFNEAGVPAGYGAKEISDYVASDPSQDRVKHLLLRYRTAFDPRTSRGLLLVGPAGTGKTHLLCSLVNYFSLQCGWACRFVDFFELTARIRASFDSPGAEGEQAILAPLVEVPVLAVDELGKGRATAWEQWVVDQLVSTRYNAGRVVLATSNYWPRAMSEAPERSRGPGLRGGSAEHCLEDRIGERVVSRLAEMCDMHPVRGPDHRRRHLG